MPAVAVISTGEELLSGRTINTNSALISRLFFGSNFKIIKHETVGDSIDSISDCIKRSLDIADIVITTGGLGPTDDDNTVEAVCKILNLKSVTDEESLKKIKNYFTSKFDFDVLDCKMASVPDKSRIIKNRSGLAPGFVVSYSNKIIISIPGVPEEAESMITLEIIPFLKKNFEFQNNIILQYRMSGIRESDINMKLNEFEKTDKLITGITSKHGVCHLTVAGIDDTFPEKETIDRLIRDKFSNFILEYNSETPEEELVYLLKEKRLTFSTAESCTGGLIAKRITDIPGASNIYRGSVIAYSNEVKIDFLNVSDETLRKYGAVSENTAAEMASAISMLLNTDISVATTGIAGPEGGSELKPVGTVCFAFKIKNDIHTTTQFFKGTRNRIRIFSSLYAINHLRNYLKKHF